MSAGAVLERFHPLVQEWFATRVGTPTAVQQMAWPAIADGEHVLVTAPTGSGKTLTAFLGALDRLIDGSWPVGALRVLYISPLKALNNDIQRNLLGPLGDLRALAEREGFPFPEIAVMTRSGDTPSRERRRMSRRPPEILITTPESLNLLLNTSSAPRFFADLRTVILDEIHAVAGTKRGTHLICGVERLVPLAGEFQRVSLSATVRPLDRVAEFVGGRRLEYVADEPVYTPRPVRLVAAPSAKVFECVVRFAGASLDGPVESSRYPALVAELKAIIHANRSTLIFCNSRRHCERITLLLNEGEPAPLAYSHHGSLSRETREVVERRLKQGELKAIVATGSLELGIDIGQLDEVVLVETPPGAAAAVQRVGRAGHGVGEVSRGRLFPLGGRDCVDAAVIGRCILAGDIEPLQPVRAPLDVLAQVIVAHGADGPVGIDALYDQLRCAWPYAELSRRNFDRVVAMLAGRYQGARLRELTARVTVDQLAGTVTSGPGGRYLVQTSGGTIPDRGLFKMRSSDTQSVIGELDEEFVWERRVGDVFSFGTRSWLIERITHNDVFVAPAGSKPTLPFWKGEAILREWHFAEQVGHFLERAEEHLDDPRFAAELRREWHLDAASIRELLGFLHRQRGLTGAPLPHRHHLLIERLEMPSEGAEAYQVVLHTLWGGRVNHPFGLALAGACEREFGPRVELHVHNDGVALILPDTIGSDELLGLVRPDDVEALLRARLEETGFFGARFRENAARALLLTRGAPGQRMPLWLDRQRAQRLLSAVAKFEDFPILLETWRTCLHDEFDLPALRGLLHELNDGRITVTECRTVAPSPFAERLAWRQINHMLYLDDTPAGRSTSLSDEVLREAVFSPHLRPEIDPALVALLEAKLQRTHEGYAPREASELLELLQERIAIPPGEVAAVRAAIARDGGDPDALLAELAGKVAVLRLPGAAESVTVALETVPRLAAALGCPPDELAPGLNLPPYAVEDVDPLTELVAQWLQFHGPLEPARLTALFGLGDEQLLPVLDGLEEAQRLVRDRLTRGAERAEICDAENLERLLAATRRGAVPAFEALPLERWPLFLAQHQGLTRRGTGVEGLQDALEPLLGCAAPAALWETEILPARVAGYRVEWLDQLLARSELLWLGAGPERLLFAFDEQRELLAEPADEAGDSVIPAAAGRYSVDELRRLTGLLGEELTARLWSEAWRGGVACDAFEAVRRGLAGGYRAAEARPAVVRRAVRDGAGRWQRGQGPEGHWFRLRPLAPPADALEQLELDKDRVRLLLDRYGVIFRELAARELPTLRWSAVFRACRILELAGEVLAGGFFRGVPGIQFASPEALSALRRPLDDEAVWWVCAADPASAAGLRLPGLEDLPDRRATGHLVYLGARPALLSTRGGQTLEFRLEPDHPRLGDVLGLFSEQQQRAVRPRRGVPVETINGAAAATSAYLPALRRHLEVTVDARRIRLWRRF